ncbi:Uncharacterised protein (plasmid) [Tsukamurella tyrosinosolvens]|uniref:Uncharacterized protein n=1 Tax=Tsukamurella tyrosinosolvens TaxID=57704 RepID=A0A1H4V575_TSUTY|nr:hypothetical protein [Tsukamurella tyrosinosolvens]KXO91059.1 hypothetical protein AXK58_21755 [Tsukamurella tyrosinosolvens]SEC75574.1 hypothetical protein SAMN04489793_3130 [Tsukamurella tyrosinosolvens]VEH90704.1 Uncharacterised protein [Tsukamurella tyrosinosolvens]
MSLTREQLYNRIDNMSLDELDLVITNAGSGFDVEESPGGPFVADIGSSWEVPDTADERGRHRFEAGPWTAYAYHPSYTAPNRLNYAQELEELLRGDVAKVVVGVTGVFDEARGDCWVFGIRTEG